MFKRGAWVPLIPAAFRWPILALWSIEPIARGIDYVTGDHPGTSNSLSFVERAMPLQVWGVLFLTAGLTTIIGFVMRWPYWAVTGLHAAGATYAALALGLAAVAFERGGDGFRTPVMFAVFALSFWLAAFGYLHQWNIEQETRRAATRQLRARGLISEDDKP